MPCPRYSLHSINFSQSIAKRISFLTLTPPKIAVDNIFANYYFSWGF